LQDFSQDTRPVSLFVYVRAFVGERENVEWQDMEICLYNGQTNERLIVRAIVPPPVDQLTLSRHKILRISRYPLAANQEWIEANEQEIVEWDFHEQNRQIHFEESLEHNGGNV
jgi:hypothetical protein